MTLYHTPYCPYCHVVRRAAGALGIHLDLVDTSRDNDAREMLLRRRGRATVPVLLIPDGGEGRLMPESADIVAYLRSLDREAPSQA
ncbi:MAG: glutathione S-transferase N-terminal domain-containing protein [Myxococcota bacterium]|nr:glutathione S-transferase N-terminal domain-containing protein [Myxococcota bacterium]